jgi:hypothetical protein
VVFGTVVLALVTGYLWGFASPHIPSMKLSWLGGCFLGCGVGYCCYWLARQTKCRNCGIVHVTAWVSGILCAYTAAVGFAMEVLAITGNRPPFSAVALAFDPVLLKDALVAIASSGCFRSGSRPMGSGELWFHWGFEALAIAVGIGAVASYQIRRQIFCEECYQWLDIKANSKCFPLPADAADVTRLKTGDLSVLDGKSPSMLKFPYCRLDYSVCKKCGNTGAYRLALVKGAAASEESALTPLMRLTPEAAVVLGQLLAREKESAEPTPEKTESVSPPASPE